MYQAMGFDELPHAMKDFVAHEFVGEKLLWAARPDVRIMMLMSCGIWIFAIPWTAFALFWESMVLGPVLADWLGYEVGGMKPHGNMGQSMLWIMGLFGLPFVLVGFGMLLAPYFVWRKGRRTVYVLTDKRLAILLSGRMIEIRNIVPSTIELITRKEGPDGRGSLKLSFGFARDSDGDRVERTETLGVIDDVRRVETLLMDIKARSR
jgi:hypothetical protein